MDIFLIVLGALCLLIAFIGSILPALPGVPLAYAALWLLHATDKVQFTWQTLLIWGVVTVVSLIIDYLVPIWGIIRNNSQTRLLRSNDLAVYSRPRLSSRFLVYKV